MRPVIGDEKVKTEASSHRRLAEAAEIRITHLGYAMKVWRICRFVVPVCLFEPGRLRGVAVSSGWRLEQARDLGMFSGVEEHDLPPVAQAVFHFHLHHCLAVV